MFSPDGYFVVRATVKILFKSKRIMNDKRISIHEQYQIKNCSPLIQFRRKFNLAITNNQFPTDMRNEAGFALPEQAA